MNPPGWSQEMISTTTLDLLFEAKAHLNEAFVENHRTRTIWEYALTDALRIGTKWPLEGWSKVVPFLLRKKADPNWRMIPPLPLRTNMTPLHLLIHQFGMVSEEDNSKILYCIPHFLRHGADIDAIDSSNNSVLDAAHSKDWRLRSALLDAKDELHASRLAKRRLSFPIPDDERTSKMADHTSRSTSPTAKEENSWLPKKNRRRTRRGKKL
jgi:hypothetical protein